MVVTDAITYSAVLLGILRAGHIAFLVSPRNSAAAVADLLNKTNCTHVLASQDPHMSRLVEEALAAIDGVIQHAMPEFEHLFSPEGTTMEDAFHDVLEMPEFDLDSPALILHSSGMRYCLP